MGEVHDAHHAITIPHHSAPEPDGEVSNRKRLLYVKVVGAELLISKLPAMWAGARDASIPIVRLTGLENSVQHFNGRRDDAAVSEDCLKSHGSGDPLANAVLYGAFRVESLSLCFQADEGVQCLPDGS